MSGPLDRRSLWRDVIHRALRSAPRSPPAHPADRVEPPRRRVVRPPGAASEPHFLAHCLPGCRLCVDACPISVIVPSLDPHQPGGGDGRPYLLPESAPCRLCGLCMWACPTGALTPTPAPQVRMGLAHIDTALCVRSQGEACTRCLEACPFPQRAIVERGGFPATQASSCTGCGACGPVCPSRAIVVMPSQ